MVPFCNFERCKHTCFLFVFCLFVCLFFSVVVVIFVCSVGWFLLLLFVVVVVEPEPILCVRV